MSSALVSLTPSPASLFDLWLVGRIDFLPTALKPTRGQVCIMSAVGTSDVRARQNVRQE